jgi:Protein of unknown function (DUF3341)
MGTMGNSAPSKPIVAGYYRCPTAFSDACAAATAAGYQPEAFTPYPIHGLEAKLGIPRSLIGRPVLTVILIGFALGLHLCYFTQVHDWPINVGGKPYFAYLTFIVVILETGLLLGALANMGIALHMCRLLPDPNTKLINDRITDDTFALVLPLQNSDEAPTKKSWLSQHGAEEVQLLNVVDACAEQPAETQGATHA